LRRLWIILGGIVGGIVLLGAVFVFWAHGSVGRLVLAGKEYEVKSEFSKAREQYDLAIQLRIFNPLVAAEAFAAVADILIQKNQPDKAVDYYKAAIENAPQNSDIAIQASTVFLARNKLDFAEKAVKDFSDSLPGIQRIRANVALRKGNTAEAQNIFAANAAQDSESVYRQWILSLIAQNTSTVIRTDAESAATKIGKSEAFENISKAYDAVTKKTASLTPQSYVVVGTVFLQNNEPDCARAAAEAALKNDPKYRDAFELQAASLLAIHDTLNAETALQNAIALSPLNPEVWYVQAKISVALQDEAVAKSSFRKAATLGQDTAKFHFDYGVFLRNSQNFQDANEELRKAYDAEKGNLEYGQEYFFNQLDSGNIQAARDIADSIMKQFPKSDFGFAARAFADFKLSEPEEEIQKNIERALSLKPESSFAAYDQGILLRKKEPDRALTYFLQAIDWDFSGDIAKRANTELEILNAQI
jgi:Tfp pilus assembly protein PilF